ncbi:SHOCT domain-containing protein [Clostridium estertheticum]|nr:SHOCT domain-containing protein [Clostridium estertheticum]
MGVKETKQIVTDEIMKYKELLDEKIITEEEFSIKKKELLITIK